MRFNWRLIVVGFVTVFVLSSLISGSFAQEDPNCPGVPAPRLVVNEQGRVTPGDANNVRDMPSRSGARVGEIPGGETFNVLEGPVCADGLNWWRVTYGDLTGWTVEGQGTDYWIEPIDPNVPTSTPLPPTALPSPTPEPSPARVFEPVRPVINVLESGVQARVISDDPNSATINLAVRSEPGLNGATVTRLGAGAIVTILDGVQETDGLIWREIETADGERGWTAEGFWNADTEQYERTLLPFCPVTENRVAFDLGRFIYTANTDGSEACALDRLLLPALHTFYPYYVYIPNMMIWSPDRSAFAYVDFVERGTSNQELFLLSADGSERRQITRDSDVYWMDWSPDGNRLALAQTINGRGAPQIWTMRIDGTAYGALTSGNNRKVWGAWLADSETLVYVENIGKSRSQMGPTAQEFIFYTVNVVRGGLTELYRTNFDLVETSISPDRSQLLIQGWEFEAIEGTEFGEYTGMGTIILDIETGEPTALEGRMPYSPIWLPDSSGLVSLSEDVLTVFTFSDANTAVIPLSRPLDSLGFIRYIDWLPDGQLVVLSSGESFRSNEDDELVAVDLTDGTVTTLVAPVGQE